MSASILEMIRALHEDIDVLERAATKLLAETPKTVRARDARRVMHAPCAARAAAATGDGVR